MTQNIGTVSWTAPEVFSKKGYTEKADVYSFGIICWELLTREKPFGDVAAFSVPLLVTKGERPSLPKDCSKEYRSFIAKCWNKRAAQRPDFVKILETLAVFKAVGPRNFLPSLISELLQSTQNNQINSHSNEERIYDNCSSS